MSVPSNEFLPDNLISHRSSWIKALDRLIELEPESHKPDMDEKSYWRHERQAMLDMYADLDRFQSARSAHTLVCVKGLVDKLEGLMKDYDFDLAQTIAAGILPDRAAYGEDISGITYSDIKQFVTVLSSFDLSSTDIQCCMCGKTGLSIIEGDGGTECQLDDGRWTCSEPCWEKAGGYGPDLSLKT